MVVRKSWNHALAVMILGLAMLSTTAHAQVPFSGPKNISNNSDFSFTPQVSVDSAGNIFIVWEDDTDTNANILFSRSTDGGVTFSTPQSVSHTSGFSFNPRIAVDAHGAINVVWEDDSPGNLDVFFSRSTDGGTTFSSPIDLSADAADSANPQVATDATGNIFVVWENDTAGLGILFSRSIDGGLTFSAPVFLSTNMGGSVSPQMLVDLTGNINVVWEDDSVGAADISYSRSANSGVSFSTPKSLSRNVGNSVSAQIAVDLAGNINVIWENNSPGNLDVFYSRSTDNGTTFSIPKNLSNDLGDSRSPQIAVDSSGSVNVLWAANIPPNFNTDVFFVRSNDGGATFSAVQNLSSNVGFSANPWLNVDAGGNVNVLWEDSTPGNRDIFFAQSSGGSATFSAPQNLSSDPGLSSFAQMAADKNANLNVVWQDATPGVSQIFFSRFSSGKTANRPPLANAGPDQNVESDGPGGTLVQLNGSGSSDPDGDVLTYLWKDETGNTVGNTAVVQLTLSIGTHTFTLTVTDPGGLTSTAFTHVSVTAANRPPVANAGADRTIGCAGPGGAQTTLDGSGSSDPDGDVLTYVWKDQWGNVVGRTAVVPLTVRLGTYTFTLTVTDPAGLSSTGTTHVTVQNTASPTLKVSLSPNSLWPPNHKLVQITATIDASDGCSSSQKVQLASITSSDPDEGQGDGDQPHDIQAVNGGPVSFGTDVRSFLLRAERSGMISGRVYTVSYTLQDASGNTTSASALVLVGNGPSDPTLQRKSEQRARNEDKKP